MKKNFLLWVLLCIFSTTSIYTAGNGSLKGKIIDDDRFSLAGANVYIKSLGLGTASDQNGEFTLVNIPEGSYDITIC